MSMRIAKSVATGLLLLLIAGCTSTEDHAPRVLIETQHESIIVELYPDKAPITTANFMRYVDSAAYREASSYRVTRADNKLQTTDGQGFMSQVLAKPVVITDMRHP